MDNKNTGMDLYEALKSGLSADELQNQFMPRPAIRRKKMRKKKLKSSSTLRNSNICVQ